MFVSLVLILSLILADASCAANYSKPSADVMGVRFWHAQGLVRRSRRSDAPNPSKSKDIPYCQAFRLVSLINSRNGGFASLYSPVESGSTLRASLMALFKRHAKKACVEIDGPVDMGQRQGPVVYLIDKIRYQL
jgi:hypothetical protein